jgi:hypothetical protein
MFDGFIYKALSDPMVQNIGSWTQPSVTNIVPTLLAMKQQFMSNTLSMALSYKYGPLGLRYFMSYPDQGFYEEYLANQLQFKATDTTQTGINRYKGHDIVPLAGLPEGTIFLTVGRPDIQSNLWIGVNSTDDVQLEMKKTSNPSDMWYVKGIFKVDVNHGFGDQMVLFSNITK